MNDYVDFYNYLNEIDLCEYKDILVEKKLCQKVLSYGNNLGFDVALSLLRELIRELKGYCEKNINSLKGNLTLNGTLEYEKQIEGIELNKKKNLPF